MEGTKTIGSTEKIWYKDMEGIQAYLQREGAQWVLVTCTWLPSVNGRGYGMHDTEQ